MPAKATRKSKAASKPYDASKKSRRARTQPKQSMVEGSKSSATPASAVHSPCLSLSIPTSDTGAVLYRDLCTEFVKSRYPGIKPRSDWELVFMTERSLNGITEEIYAELDKEFSEDVEQYGLEEIERMVAITLGRHVHHTGFKPLPKETNKYVYIRSIPDTPYSIRLFPGSLATAEYCLDFVDSASGEPVNSPFEFELWGVPDPETPWLSVPITQKIRSIERAHGIKQEDILPGHEKFILRDGLTCVLIRPGKPKIQFTVPIRKLPQAPAAALEEVIVFELPKVIT
ncbi:hypothetical protein BV20DRAFT_1043208 [Pilatotrama ljubarskyi]|nr:hypothetical protein BV20DRAFT_1043208 [Pilatotrama ljubarskyi]